MFPDDICGPKAVIAALRLRGGGRKEKLDRCRREAELYTGCGVSALLIADRGAELQDLAAALELLRGWPCPLGVSAGGDFFKSWELARRSGAKFIFAASVAGQLRREEDAPYAEQLAACRAGSQIRVIGGVRFEQQPILSGRPWAEDLRLGMERCDAVAVSGSGRRPGDAGEKDRTVPRRRGGFSPGGGGRCDGSHAGRKADCGGRGHRGPRFSR